MLVVKGDFAANEDIEDDAEGPDIDLRPSVHFRVEQLRCGKVERATKGGEVRSGVVEVREAEIDDFNITGFGYEDILDLEVCVQDKYECSIRTCERTAPL